MGDEKAREERYIFVRDDVDRADLGNKMQVGFAGSVPQLHRLLWIRQEAQRLRVGYAKYTYDW